MSAFRKLIARLSGRYGEVAAPSCFRSRLANMPVRILHSDAFDYVPVFVPILSSAPLGHCDAVDHGEHGRGEIFEARAGSVGSLPFVSVRYVTVPEQGAFGGIENVRRQGDRLVELDDHMRQKIGVERFQHGHASHKGQHRSIAFFIRHVILRGLIARIKAVLRGRVE